MSDQQNKSEDKKSMKALVLSEYETLSRQIPDEWGGTPKEKKALIRSVHVGVLGKDKEGKMRPLTDLVYFLFQCTQRKLNPFKGQIHAVYIWNSEMQSEQLVTVTGIGGFRAMAQRSKQPIYAGSSKPTFNFKDVDDKHPYSAEVDVFAYNPVTGAREVVATGLAHWDEFVRNKKNARTNQWEPNATWGRMPRLMLAKCAEALALRQAFPEDLSGMYIEEEVDRLKAIPAETDLTVDGDVVKRKVKEAESNFKNGKDKK